MKLIEITLKDLTLSLRSRTIYFFAIGLPIFTALLFYFAFSGMGNEQGSIELKITEVLIVNEDEPQADFGFFSAGAILTDFLMSDELSNIIHAEEIESTTSAIEAIESQLAGVVVIIPKGFTSQAFDPEGKSDIIIYHDPTLTIGPAIVGSLVSQFVDGFSGAIITTDVVADQLEARGVEATRPILQDAAQIYSEWAQIFGQMQSEPTHPLITFQTPKMGEESSNLGTRLITQMMSGMLIFYSFFTGANVAQSILQEDEDGTLARLFTTPTSRATILGGKFITVFITTTGQIIVTVLATDLMFNINWGDLRLLSIAVFSLVLLASSFGIFVISFMKSVRQAGPVLGVVMTLSGMAGGLFTSAMPSIPEAFETITLLTPQGWSHKIWNLAMENGDLGEMLLPLSVVIVMASIFFLIGSLVFRRRFA